MLNESEWIQWIKSHSPSFDAEWIQEGIGDDAAILKTKSSERLLISTDSLIEDVHFKRTQNPFEIGYKALAVNISDISAMGGRARAFTLNLSFPSQLDKKWVEDFFNGLWSLSKAHQITLIGGDTTRSEKIMVSINIFGTQVPDKIKHRSGAKEGDLIFVTGHLGESAGLRDYLQPPVRMAEAEFFANCSEVRSLMDLSDGLLKDLPRLADASGCGFQVDLETIPLSSELRQRALALHQDPLEWAIAGGEDYELLGTIDAKAATQILEEFSKRFTCPIHLIGKITHSGQNWLKGEHSFHIPWKSFEHFF